MSGSSQVACLPLMTGGGSKCISKFSTTQMHIRMNIMNLDRLASYLRNCKYPSALKHIDRGILGRGFYPGAQGFIAGNSPLGGILLLGRDFGTKDYYNSLCGLPARDETAITWRHTRDIYLESLGCLPVWCSNYLIGVRKTGSSKGNIKNKLSASEWQEFERYCWDFLQEQVLLQRPLLVVIFGGDNRRDLTLPNRLGSVQGSELKHIFGRNGEHHSAVVTFADHPHSLIRECCKDVAREFAMQLRHRYETLRDDQSGML